MSEVEVPSATVSTAERWLSLARRARGAMEAFRTMVVQAQETGGKHDADICAKGLMFADVVLDSVRARCPEAAAAVGAAEGDIDTDPFTLEDAEEVMKEVDRRIGVMRRFVHPDAATGGVQTDNLVRNVPFGQTRH